MDVNKCDNIWEYRIKEAFNTTKERTEGDIIWDITSLLIYQSDKDGLLGKIYNLFDNKKDFVKLISLLDGQKFQSPTKHELEEMLLLAILYYEKEIEGKDWETIKKNYDFKISSIKYGIRIKNMNNWLRQKIQEVIK